MNKDAFFPPLEKKTDAEDSPAEAAAEEEEEAAKQEDRSDEVGGAAAEASQVFFSMTEDFSEHFTFHPPLMSMSCIRFSFRTSHGKHNISSCHHEHHHLYEEVDA